MAYCPILLRPLVKSNALGATEIRGHLDKPLIVAFTAKAMLEYDLGCKAAGIGGYLTSADLVIAGIFAKNPYL